MFGKGDLCLDLASIRVEDVVEAAGGPLNGFAPYKVANLTHGSFSSDFLKRPRQPAGFRPILGRFLQLFDSGSRVRFPIRAIFFSLSVRFSCLLALTV